MKTNWMNIEHNNKFKTMYDATGYKWKYGYSVYAQLYNKDIYVTFYTEDYREKVHFNHSGSIDISIYTKESILLDMIETAKLLGWISRP